MFENLQDKLERAFKTLKGHGTITELNVAATMKDIRRALVDADVNYKIAKEFTDTVKNKAIGQNVLTAVSPGQLLVKIMQDELTELMGGTVADVKLEGKPAIILIAGLQGSGKTTFSAKLANYMRTKRKKRPLLVAGDVYRPAAIEQLKVLGKQIEIPVYTDEGSKDPVGIATNAITYAKANNHDLVIIDTAGRLAIDEQMMNEISAVKQHTNPDETLFVVDSMTGQDAVNTAHTFNERLNFDGVVLTKLDGDTRGGAALSIKYTVNKPIKFVSYGEKMETIDLFYPDRMAQRILGMGDIVSFVEKAQEQFDAKQAEELQKKIRKNQFDFNDFLYQLNQLRKMGNIKDIAAMIPGMGKMLKDVEIEDSQFKRFEAIIFSMTPAERANPDLIDASRRRRIAYGSGNSITDINAFMKQFDQMRKMLNTMSKMSMSGKAMNALQALRKR
ncbi:MAG TPA: signal recognition particle protein [Chitinophagales bacterium]|nr:signal recognition particle protein [Chitinophagales bacterium]HRK26349.1 signal recognition particle protein [Chitinophagales bacterium]